MFATRDQENLVHGHQQVAASKPLNQGARGLQPKTPGNKYPKTPLKIPFNDENAIGGFGQSVKGKGIENLVTGGKKTTFDKSAFVTPLGPRARAPLGAKTTNAKAKGFQTPARPAPAKDVEKTQPQASTRRPKKVTHPETVKIEVHGDESPLKLERDIEYAPPNPQNLPYESEDFPSGCLNYEPLKKGNLMRGIYKAYHTRLDEHGLSEADRRVEEGYAAASKKADDAIMKAMEEEWTVRDVPETFAYRTKKTDIHRDALPPKKPPVSVQKVPATIAQRNAASALSSRPVSRPAASVTTALKPKTNMPSFLVRSKPKLPSSISNRKDALSENSTMRHTAAIAASRSTIGYSKGRSASGAVQTQKRSGLTRSISNMSQSSEVTITPARFAHQEGLESKKPDWLSAFEVDDEELEPGLRGGIPECLRKMDDDEEEFVMTLE